MVELSSLIFFTNSIFNQVALHVLRTKFPSNSWAVERQTPFSHDHVWMSICPSFHARKLALNCSLSFYLIESLLYCLGPFILIWFWYVMLDTVLSKKLPSQIHNCFDLHSFFDGDILHHSDSNSSLLLLWSQCHPRHPFLLVLVAVIEMWWNGLGSSYDHSQAMGKISAVVPSASNGLLSQEIVLDNDSWTLQHEVFGPLKWYFSTPWFLSPSCTLMKWVIMYWNNE